MGRGKGQGGLVRPSVVLVADGHGEYRHDRRRWPIRLLLLLLALLNGLGLLLDFVLRERREDACAG